MPRIIPEPRYFSMPSIEVGAEVHEARFELLAMGVVVDPFARCRNPLACRDSGGVADDRDQIAMATGLCPQNAEAVLAIVEGDTLDKARQYFLGRWFLLWPHLCCHCWRQSPQPDLETCAALALLVSDAVPASTFDRRPPTRWQPSSDSNPRLSSQ